ncbi:MAG TPA: PASTA domain-containing protein [Puia sp.]|nr:PASTA domain-containing protein [Puia sp.]
MFKFLTSKPLWVNILAGIVLLLLLLLLFLGSLALLTQHGKTMTIPSVTGMSFADAKKSLQTQGFEVQIQDSSGYVDTMKPMQVIKQFPEADNLVKINRTIYLTINRSQAPFIQMPNLVSMSFRNAVNVLKQYGLKMGDTIFKPDFARNSVLDQQYNGETIKPGTTIQQGSSIALVLGSGVGGQEFGVPDLIGLTYVQARARLDSFGLSIGVVVRDPDVRDTTEAYIYKQDPPQFGEDGQVNHIHMGQLVNVTLGTRKPVQNGDSASPAPSAY